MMPRCLNRAGGFGLYEAARRPTISRANVDMQIRTYIVYLGSKVSPYLPTHLGAVNPCEALMGTEANCSGGTQI